MALYNFNKDEQAFLSNQIELYPTEEQKNKLQKYIIATNYMFDIIIDWMDNKYINYLNADDQYKFLSMFDCQKMIKELRLKDQFLIDIPLHILEACYNRAIYAFKAFLDKGRRHTHPIKHYPNNIIYSFDIDLNCSFYIKNGYLTLPGFANKSSKGERVGSIKCQNIGLDTSINKIYNGSIFMNNIGRYYFYYTYKVDRTAFNYPKTQPLGIDLGYRLDGSNTIVCSDGSIYKLPDVRHLISRIKYFQSEYESTANRESENFHKFQLAHKKLFNVLDTFYNQATIDIIKKNPEAIIIEDCFARDLKIRSKNNFINYGVTSSGRIRTMIIYKAFLYRIPVYIANGNFESSYFCSRCYRLSIMDLKQKKIFKCQYCGYEIDRDLNASINLRNLYIFRDQPNILNSYIKEIIM